MCKYNIIDHNNNYKIYEKDRLLKIFAVNEKMVYLYYKTSMDNLYIIRGFFYVFNDALFEE